MDFNYFDIGFNRVEIISVTNELVNYIVLKDIRSNFIFNGKYKNNVHFYFFKI